MVRRVGTPPRNHVTRVLSVPGEGFLDGFLEVGIFRQLRAAEFNREHYSSAKPGEGENPTFTPLLSYTMTREELNADQGCELAGSRSHFTSTILSPCRAGARIFRISGFGSMATQSSMDFTSPQPQRLVHRYLPATAACQLPKLRRQNLHFLRGFGLLHTFVAGRG